MTQKVGLFVTLALYGLPILEFNPRAQKMQNFRYTSTIIDLFGEDYKEATFAYFRLESNSVDDWLNS